MHLYLDNWLAGPIWEAMRAQAEKANYESVYQGGYAFPGFAEVPIMQEELDAFQRLLGEPKLEGRASYRKYEDDILQPTFIHSDESVADFTGILFMNYAPETFGGIQFYSKYEWQDDQPGAKKSAYIPMRPNRLVLFDAADLHSRWPQHPPKQFERLIKVYFLKRVVG